MLSIFHKISNLLFIKQPVNVFSPAIERPLTDDECDRLCEISNLNMQGCGPIEISNAEMGLLELGLVDENWTEDGTSRTYWLTVEGKKLQNAILSA